MISLGTSYRRRLLDADLGRVTAGAGGRVLDLGGDTYVLRLHASLEAAVPRGGDELYARYFKRRDAATGWARTP